MSDTFRPKGRSKELSGAEGAMMRRLRLFLPLFFVLALLGGASLALGIPSQPSSWFQEYWRLPIPPQGSPPPDFHPLAASLNPESCAACHSRQYADWQTSLHAHAMGPGVTGQLVDFLRSDPREAQSCMNCHAPLSEQQELSIDHDGVLRPNPAFDPILQRSAVSCAACHVRDFHRNGPLRNPDRPSGITWRGLPAKPHGDVDRTANFGISQFCAACHQFPAGNEVNGKPLENTLVEWQASDFGRRGISCQQCHMPERRHLWRGIHDPETIRRGVTLSLEKAMARGGVAEGTLRIRSVGVGHHFPTYVTPMVVVRMEQQADDGRPLAGTRREWWIGRKIDFTPAGPKERWDTRIPSGERRDFCYRERLSPEARRIRAWVQVYPDHHYTGFYHQALGQTERSSGSVAQIAEALKRSQQSSYLIFDQSLAIGIASGRLPPPNAEGFEGQGFRSLAIRSEEVR